MDENKTNDINDNLKVGAFYWVKRWSCDTFTPAEYMNDLTWFVLGNDRPSHMLNVYEK